METKIFNTKINYEVIGKGYPVVLLHGWLANIETMRPIANGLSQHFKVYMIDVIGMGKSELPEKSLNTNNFGDFLAEFINKLKIKNPILIGHSNGGRMIINSVGRGLVKPKKIVLIDSAGLKDKHGIKYYFKIWRYKLGKNALKLLPETESIKKVKKEFFEKNASADYKNSPEVLRKTMKKILSESQEKYLSKIKVPTLLVWGENDTATPIWMAKKMEKLLPDVGLVEYKNSGHYSYLENIGNFNIVLNEFLKNEKK